MIDRYTLICELVYMSAQYLSLREQCTGVVPDQYDQELMNEAYNLVDGMLKEDNNAA